MRLAEDTEIQTAGAAHRRVARGRDGCGLHHRWRAGQRTWTGPRWSIIFGADEVEIADGAFVIYQGSHGDRGAHRADVILPGAAYTEEQGLFVNTEGRPQLALRAGFAPGEAKENWAILRALSGEMGAALPFDSLAQLRKAMVEVARRT